MKSNNILIFLLTSLVLFFNTLYCKRVDTIKSSQGRDINKSSEQNHRNFEDFWIKFIKAFNEKNTLEINKFLNPEYGFFVLDNPGAIYIVRHFDSFDEIMEMEGESDIAYLKVLKVDCDLKEGEKPFYECESDGWNKEGCYLEKYPELKISDYYKTMIEYELIDSNSVKKEMELSLKAENMITHLVYSTEAPIGFYFAMIDEKWYLICIDKVTPCDA